MIPELYKVQLKDPEDNSSVQKAFQYLHDKSTPTTFTTVPPTANQVPLGGIVVHDDGTNRRLYFRTGAGKVGYINFTATI